MEQDQNRRRSPMIIGVAAVGLLLLLWGVAQVSSDPAITGEAPPEEQGLQWEHRDGKWLIVDVDEKGEKVWAGDTEIVPFFLLIKPTTIAMAGGAITFIIALLIGIRQFAPEEPEPVSQKATPAPAGPRQYVETDPNQPLDSLVSLTRTPTGALPRPSAQTPMPARRISDDRLPSYGGRDKVGPGSQEDQ